MSSRLDGRVAIVTGAGRGVGRSHAIRLAAEGAAVVVNDLGTSLSGEGSDPSPAASVVAEISEAGGRAIESSHDIADWRQAGELIETAVQTFGTLDVLVNNAGVLRDRTLANLSEAEWDTVIRVHLKGHAAPVHHAMAHWRRVAKSDGSVRASVIHTSSVAAFFGNFGQAAYASAKLAVLGLSRVVSLEGSRYGVRSNVVAPSARTRLGAGQEQDELLLAAPEDPNAFDRFAPSNVSPLIAWLATSECQADSQIFYIFGERLFVISMPTIVTSLVTEGSWTLENLDRELPPRLVQPPTLDEIRELWSPDA